MEQTGVTGEMIRNPIALLEITVDPPSTPDTGYLYTKDVAGATQLFYKDSAGVVNQLTPITGLGVTLNGAYNFGGAGLGRTITAISGSVDISSTVNNTLDLTRTQATEIANVGNVSFTTTYSAVGMADNKLIEGFNITLNYTGNTSGTNRMFVTGQSNTVNLSNTSGRVYSGSLGSVVHEAIYNFKTVYSPGGTGRPSSIMNLQSRYDHLGSSSSGVGNLIGIDALMRFATDDNLSSITYSAVSVIAIRGMLRFNTTSGAGTITNAIGIQATGASYIGTGVTITNNYSLKVETASGGVNNWSLYVTGGLSYFGGNIQALGTMDMTGGNAKWFRPPSMTTAQETAMVAVGPWGAGDAGKMWYNTTTNQWKGWNGTVIVIIG